MTDVLFVAASYAIVVGGLGAYAVTIARRARTARRIAQALQRERALDATAASGETPANPGEGPIEVQR